MSIIEEDNLSISYNHSLTVTKVLLIYGEKIKLLSDSQ